MTKPNIDSDGELSPEAHTKSGERDPLDEVLMDFISEHAAGFGLNATPIKALKIRQKAKTRIFELFKAREATLQRQAELAGYDPNRQGHYIFVGDADRLKNLDDLYWSYVAEYVAQNTAHYDNYKLDYLKKNMPSASFHNVGIHKLLARADQYARERLAALQEQSK